METPLSEKGEATWVRKFEGIRTKELGTAAGAELGWAVAVRELRVGNQSPGGEAASAGPGGESRDKNEGKTEVWGTDRKI